MPPCLPKNKKHQHYHLHEDRHPSYIYIQEILCHFHISWYNNVHVIVVILLQWFGGNGSRKKAKQRAPPVRSKIKLSKELLLQISNDLVKWLEWENQAESSYFGKERLLQWFEEMTHRIEQKQSTTCLQHSHITRVCISSNLRFTAPLHMKHLGQSLPYLKGDMNSTNNSCTHYNMMMLILAF